MTSRCGDWIQTFTGRAVWPLDPRPGDICAVDIAHALANLCRFTGHCRAFYSVAEHSINVSHRVPQEDALWGLLHDAAEAYLCDLPAPLKRLPEFAFYREAEAWLMAAICERFGLPSQQPASVTEADARMLATEARDLMAPPPMRWELEAAPYSFTMSAPLKPGAAETSWLGRFDTLVAAERMERQ